mgnify:CR=1 FL=1
MSDFAARRIMMVDTQVRPSDVTKFPIILVGREYWGGLLDWIKNTLLKANTISPEDLDLIELVDTKDEVMECLNRFYTQDNFKPNF